MASTHGGAVAASALTVDSTRVSWPGGEWPWEYALLMGIASLLMLLGIVDDLRDLSAKLRFALYGLCCLATVVLLLPSHLESEPWLMRLLLVLMPSLAILWLLNLYNFIVRFVKCFSDSFCISFYFCSIVLKLLYK